MFAAPILEDSITVLSFGIELARYQIHVGNVSSVTTASSHFIFPNLGSDTILRIVNMQATQLRLFV